MTYLFSRPLRPGEQSNSPLGGNDYRHYEMDPLLFIVHANSTICSGLLSLSNALSVLYTSAR